MRVVLSGCGSVDTFRSRECGPFLSISELEFVQCRIDSTEVAERVLAMLLVCSLRLTLG